MKITITFLHLEHTESLDERIREKSQKLKKFFQGEPHIKWTCYVKNGRHYAEVSIHGGKKSNYHATAHSENLYKTIDLAVEKVEKQLHKHKDKVKNKIHKKKKEKVILEPENAWIEQPDDFDFDYEDAA